MMPKSTKSVTMTTSVTSHAMAATIEANTAPQMPEPSARRKAMKARPQAMGWRIMTRVRAFELSVAAVVNWVPSMVLMMAAGL